MMLYRINTGIFEEKGIWRESFVPTEEEIQGALLNVEFVKEGYFHSRSGRLIVYHSCICGEEGLTALRYSDKIITIRGKKEVENKLKRCLNSNLNITYPLISFLIGVISSINCVS